MAKRQEIDEPVRKFKDLTNKSWLPETDSKSAKVGDNQCTVFQKPCLKDFFGNLNRSVYMFRYLTVARKHSSTGYLTIFRWD
jgi:hypothetical protein